MKVFVPNNFKEERKYIVNILLNEYLGLNYEIEFSNEKNYKILLDNNSIITIKDSFWNNLDEQTGYLEQKKIPKKVVFSENKFISEKNIPIIYGSEECELKNNEIFCGIDIFASSFFMLTRWEEIVIAEKDKHNRFRCELSLAQKQNFSHRAIVNEYVEMLWNMLVHSNCKQKRKQRKHEIIPTHDIDFLFLFDSFYNFLKVVGGDILKRRSISLAFKTTKNYIGFKFGKAKDPYDTFEYLMDISEKNKIKSHFYFIAGKKTELDVRYNFLKKETKKIIDNIIKRGHFVGIHGSYSSYNNNEQFKKEIKRFDEFEIRVDEGRQHYLRFENPLTWQIWNNNKMKYDSSIGYTNGSGFRAGTCYEYPVFDVQKRKKLDLIERPLIFMETTSRAKFSKDEDFKKQLIELKNTTKKYNGQFVFLWHNSNFNVKLFRELIDFYPQIFEK